MFDQLRLSGLNVREALLPDKSSGDERMNEKCIFLIYSMPFLAMDILVHREDKHYTLNLSSTLI